MSGAVRMNESIRSKIPPCPGIKFEESFAPASLFIKDSIRSESWPKIPINPPKTNAWKISSCAVLLKIAAAIRQTRKPAIAPSQVLCGLTTGASFLRPQAEPT